MILNLHYQFPEGVTHPCRLDNCFFFFFSVTRSLGERAKIKPRMIRLPNKELLTANIELRLWFYQQYTFIN